MPSNRENNDRPPLPGAGYLEDYTVPFLCVAGVLCFVVLFVLWASAGLPLAIACAAAADWLMRR